MKTIPVCTIVKKDALWESARIVDFNFHILEQKHVVLNHLLQHATFSFHMIVPHSLGHGIILGKEIYPYSPFFRLKGGTESHSFQY